MNVLKVINKTLSKTFGFTIVKNKKRLKLNSETKKPRKIFYIEFIGISGVGKTTLCNAFLKDKNNSQYVGIRQFRSSNQEKATAFKNKLFYEHLIKNKLNIFKEKKNKTALSHLKQINVRYTKLMDDAIIYNFNENYTICADTGIFWFYDKSIRKLQKDYYDDFIKFIDGRVLIHCYAPPSVIIKNIKKRYQETGINRHQAFDNRDKDLGFFLEKSMKDKKELINLLKPEMPILEINTSHDLEENVKKVAAFIEQLENNSDKQ